MMKRSMLCLGYAQSPVAMAFGDVGLASYGQDRSSGLDLGSPRSHRFDLRYYLPSGRTLGLRF